MTHLWLAVSFTTALALGQVQTEELPATHETVYRVALADTANCTLSWTLARTTPNRNVVQQRVACPVLSFATFLSGVDQIITGLEQREPDRLLTLDTLFVGTLSSYPELRARLSLLAALSNDWDPVHERPRSGGPTAALIERIAKQPEFLSGLDDVFGRHGIHIEVSSVESVRTARAATLPNYPDLKRNAIQPDSRIPSNCLLWIRLTHSKGTQIQP